MKRGPLLAVVIAVLALAVGWVASRTASDHDAPAAPRPVAVTSNAPRHATLAELADASDLVVRGTVAGTAHGRVFGDPGDAATIESRVLTLRIDHVLRGTAPTTPTVLVEEEGWDGDGAPLVVDGASASRRGDTGIWFLVSVASGEEHRFVIESAEGRYLDRVGTLHGASGDDPLIGQLVALGPDGLAAAITALAP